ncbi:MAG: hypothetical protein IPP97_19215 [Candidatus Obscuribacter sp.]|jgi:hypothetical protein|nr:hypothetical protein [Candidatus Obscuribacter sp.]MBP6348724.1 hypothetical protein [Candidatus Obscuribacter sp.]MBP6592345.1 hypothetical protein [Candidatus Obscuribacter sp.]MBP7576280.1 hypothetical protein [Candidatus Obscuribacter sp.]
MHKRRRNLQLLAVTFALLSTLILPVTLPNHLSTLLSPVSAQNQWFGLRLKEKSPEPLVLNEHMRKPLKYFKQALDERWRPGALFFFCVFISLSLSLLPFKTLQSARQTMRESVVKSLTYSFVYSFLLMVLARSSFEKEALLPMGLISMGILEVSYTLGLATGILALSDRLCEIFKIKDSGKGSCWQRALTIVLTCLAVALLSTIPGFAMLPRIGNRLVLLLAMLGLGGILLEQYRKAKA